ncbi:M48 family metalloprotease [Limobrevibacterium gyesilva]|uniref:M48 family metalloprotease n=1 Tax=Limobrevibacterium gyesilva TaxID=2991712 RepID=A0AA42CFL8_9PROT|nr:M48 family metalloprotease [Limobrevibacterium gyesilva]MCW3473117.1 M48 family metalloprotease [Limobrevibacterium gyesilva]
MRPRLLIRILSVLLSMVVLAGLLPAGPAAAQAPPGSGGPRVILIRDAETETLLRTYANPLFRAAGVDPNLVRIILIRDNAINSFVSTGNRMFVHTGLIMQAESALEMVGVLAHETGHIAGGHLARLPDAMRQAMIESIVAVLIGAAAGAVTRDSGAIGAGLGAQQMAMRNFLSFTRGIEQSADQGAMAFLDRNQWSARGLLDLFNRLESQEALNSTQQDPYLLTHPLTRERMAFVQEHVARSPYSNNQLPPGFEQGFQMVRAKLHGFLDPSSVTLRTVAATDKSAPARYARAIALHRLARTNEALALIDGLLAEQAGSPWLHELKGQMLFEGGRVREALGPYREAARLAPDQPQIRAALAHAMIESGDPLLLRPAVQQLQSALDRDREDSDAWRSLGIAWGRVGDLGQANLALAEEAMLLGDIRTARALATKAEKLLPAGPARLRATDISNAVKKENREGF